MSARTNYLVHGPVTETCRRLPRSIRFDLVYMDPPFGVGTTMTARKEAGQARGRKKPGSGPSAYVDGRSIDSLIEMLRGSLEAVRARMNPAALLYLHLDHRCVHDAKMLCDELFGRDAYVGEIIWTPGNGGRGARGFAVTHQTILLYVRHGDERADILYQVDDPALREPYADTSLAMHFKRVDADGRQYRERTISGKTYRYYADLGRRLGSVWTDIPAMVANTPLRKEATGYPTQKPEALLDRIVRASSTPNSTVADLMCGSGTTLAAAARLGRRIVGGDQGQLAIDTASKRLRDAGVPFRSLKAVDA